MKSGRTREEVEHLVRHTAALFYAAYTREFGEPQTRSIKWLRKTRSRERAVRLVRHCLEEGV